MKEKRYIMVVLEYFPNHLLIKISMKSKSVKKSLRAWSFGQHMTLLLLLLLT